jgi:hypothetical protein
MRRIAHTLVLAAIAVGVTYQPLLAAEVEAAPTAVSAEVLLQRGESAQAYYQLRDEIDTGAESAQIHVLAAKAALARAKTAPLLRKKKWAKRGRSHYASALSLDENQAEALFGLATFALRAPSGLGGGEEAFTQYRSRLEAVAPEKTVWLDARMHAENKSYGAALELYAQAVSQQDELLLRAEFAALAIDRKQSETAYALLSAGPADQAPCDHHTLAQLAKAADRDAADILAHYDAFFEGQQLYCGRRFVALEAAQAAKDAAANAGASEREAYYEGFIASLESNDAADEKSSDIAS